MARQTQSKTLKDSQGVERVVAVDQLPAMRAWLVLRDLGEAVLPNLARLAKAAAAGGSLEELDVQVLGDAAQQVFLAMPGPKLERLTRELVATATLDGKDLSNEPVFSEAFRGEMLLLLQALRFAVEVNFSDFSGALLAAGRKRVAAPKSASATSTTSPGPSTG